MAFVDSLAVHLDDHATRGAAGGRRPSREAAPSGVDLCLLCALLVVCPPAGIVWLLLSRRRPPGPPAGARGQVGTYAQDR